jgi:surface polysaccharide O-acyltransferase-like enzyme
LNHLFVISVVTVPLLVYLKSDPGRRVISWLAAVAECRGGVFLLILPLAALRVAFQFLFGGAYGWDDLSLFVVFFLAGYVLPADERFTSGIRRHGWIALAAGILGFAAEGFFIFVLSYNYAEIHHPGGETFSGKYVAFHVVVSIASWSLVVFITSLAVKYGTAAGRLVAYGNEAVLPFYVLHQTVILVVGWFVLPWGMPPVAAFLIIAVASFALTMGVYEGPVRRVGVVRWLFGMRQRTIRAPKGA